MDVSSFLVLSLKRVLFVPTFLHLSSAEAKKWKYRYKKKSGGSWKSSDLLSKPGIKKKKITGLKRCTKYIIQTKERDADKFWSGWSAKTNFKTKGC